MVSLNLDIPLEKVLRHVSGPRVTWAIFLACSVVAVPLIAMSWRRSCDPIVDFGRELYVPWRISNGALLFRDVLHHYGPLSQHYHACLFYLFGPGLSRLMWSNVLLYFATLAMLLRLTHRGWGAAAALGGGIVFVTVFSFSHLTHFGNYNWLTPYLHEVTHGFTASVALVSVLTADYAGRTRLKLFIAGLLCGIATLLKPEPMLACGLAMASVIGLSRFTRNEKSHAGVIAVALESISFVTGALLPLAVMTLYFVMAGLSWSEALEGVNMAWYAIFKYDISGSVDEQVFLGQDDVTGNLIRLGAWAVVSLSSIAVLLAIARWLGNFSTHTQAAVYAAAGVVLFACGFRIRWTDCGKILPALLLAALVHDWVTVIRTGRVSRDAEIRLLIGALAIGFLARMALNPRIYHYGFVQASLASVVAVGFLVRTAPALARLPRQAHFGWLGVGAVCGMMACSSIVGISQSRLAAKVLPIGKGDDLIYAYHPDYDASGRSFQLAGNRVAALPNHAPLLVIPEGVMMNYMLRSPSPVPAFQYLPASLNEGQSAQLVDGLIRNPPAAIVFLPRDTREHGIAQRYGESPEHGRDLVLWALAHYEPIAADGEPLNPRDPGGWAVLTPRLKAPGTPTATDQ